MRVSWFYDQQDTNDQSNNYSYSIDSKHRKKNVFTWQASFPGSPPAQKLLAGRMNIFSVTALTCRMHSASLTMGISASRTRNGIGPAAKEFEKRSKNIEQKRNSLKKMRFMIVLNLTYDHCENSTQIGLVRSRDFTSSLVEKTLFR